MIFFFHRWDCNTTKYEEFKYNFHCNLLRECLLYEDESNCTYSSPDCPNPHFISGNDSCFFFDAGYQWDTKLSWNETFHICRNIDKRYSLPILNTPAKFKEALNFQSYRHIDLIFIGLTSNSSLPFKFVKFSKLD